MKTISAIEESKINAFKDQLRGYLIMPKDSIYDESRKVYNAMIDKKPAMIVKCVDVADVIAAVNFGREHDILIAVRGGGHNGGAWVYAMMVWL